MLIKLIFVLIFTVSLSNGFWLLNCLGDQTPFECKCLRKLYYQDRIQWTKCYQIVNQYFDDSFNYCCALREFQRCAFLLIKRRCFSLGVNLFELQMRQTNSLCHVITGGFDKCEGWTPPGGPPSVGTLPDGPPPEGSSEGLPSYRPPQGPSTPSEPEPTPVRRDEHESEVSPWYLKLQIQLMN